MPKLGNPRERGDIYVEVKVVLPQQLSERERQLFEELASLRAEGAGQAAGKTA